MLNRGADLRGINGLLEHEKLATRWANTS